MIEWKVAADESERQRSRKVSFFTGDRSPYAEDALVTGFPVGIISFQGEACFDRKIQAGFILKIDADVVVAGSG